MFILCVRAYHITFTIEKQTMKYIDVRSNSKKFLALTGVNITLFDEILPWFEEEHNHYLRYHDITGKRRSGKRAGAIYANSPLPTVADRLFFLLVYLKNNPIQEYHAECFGMTQQQCGKWIHGLTTILELALKSSGMLPAKTMKEFIAVLEKQGGAKASHILLHDGTEREIPRPYDADKQKENYSGKKKKHTVKNAVITTMTAIILFVGQTVSGAVHDKTIADTQYDFPFLCQLWQDTGYQGYRPTNAVIMQPTKKPKGGELTPEQKAENKNISSRRIRVEHAIGGAKRLRIVKDECRLRANDYVGRIFHIAAGLHNWRLSCRA